MSVLKDAESTLFHIYRTNVFPASHSFSIRNSSPSDSPYAITGFLAARYSNNFPVSIHFHFYLRDYKKQRIAFQKKLY
ncbi:MAG: hypothetical protein IPH77_11885 [Ignavibacteria bacterium]|nr:hypothetical protein [Ignavibacteria bacterium]